MRAAVKLRADYTAGHLRVLARRSSDAGQTRRLLALAVIDEGGSRGEAAKTGTCRASDYSGLGAGVQCRGA